MSEEDYNPIAYARSMAAWWRGDRSSCPPVTAEALRVAKDAYRAVIRHVGPRQGEPMAEIAASWDRAADLLEKGGAP